MIPILLASASALAETKDLDDKTTLGKPVTHANLTIIPVLLKDADAAKKDKDYLVLDEAFDKKLVEVKEKDSESVNELVLVNKGDQPLFVMAGEVIIGGKQDRIISKDIIIGANQKVTVPVSCVEHGRWSEEKGSRTFRSGKALAHTKLRLQTNYKQQQDVWNEVADKTRKRKVENDTQTYRKVAAAEDKDSRKVKESVEPYAKAFDKAFEDERTVGFVVVLNGEISGVETFGSPKLFKKLKPKMLASYYVEAVDIPVDAEKAKKEVTVEAVKSFKGKADGKSRKTVVENKGRKAKTLQYDLEDVAGSEVVDEEAAPAAAQPEVYKATHAK